MNDNTTLLNYIHQNTEMGLAAIDKLLDVVEEEKMRRHLKIQKNEYQSIDRTAVSKLERAGHREKNLNPIAKVGVNASIGRKTLINKSPSHIAEMMIEGSTMGIIDITKNRKKYQNADHDILALADKLMATEQSNIDQLKRFL